VSPIPKELPIEQRSVSVSAFERFSDRVSAQDGGARSGIGRITRAALTDATLFMFDKLLGSMSKRPKGRPQKRTLKRSAKSTCTTLGSHWTICDETLARHWLLVRPAKALPYMPATTRYCMGIVVDVHPPTGAILARHDFSSYRSLANAWEGRS
jgi:hypothetical protein